MSTSYKFCTYKFFAIFGLTWVLVLSQEVCYSIPFVDVGPDETVLVYMAFETYTMSSLKVTS